MTNTATIYVSLDEVLRLGRLDNQEKAERDDQALAVRREEAKQRKHEHLLDALRHAGIDSETASISVTPDNDDCWTTNFTANAQMECDGQTVTLTVDTEYNLRMVTSCSKCGYDRWSRPIDNRAAFAAIFDSRHDEFSWQHSCPEEREFWLINQVTEEAAPEEAAPPGAEQAKELEGFDRLIENARWDPRRREALCHIIEAMELIADYTTDRR